MNEKMPVAIFLSSVSLAIILLVGIFVIPWRGVSWGVLRTLPANTVVVTGEAKTEQQNQIATYTAGASAVNDDKQTAMNEVNRKMDAIVQALMTFGIRAEDMKTQNLNVNQSEESYYQDGVQKSRPGQWRVSNTVEIKLRDVSRAQGLTDILTKSGATNIYGPNYSLDDTNTAANTLMGKALDDAKAKAALMAGSGGRKLGPVVSIVENYTPQTYYGGGGGIGGGGQPGTNTVTKTLTVTFELQ